MTLNQLKYVIALSEENSINEAAKKLYGSFGFVELNEPGYYGEGDEISAVLKL